MSPSHHPGFVLRVSSALQTVIGRGLCSSRTRILVAVSKEISSSEYAALRQIAGIEGIVFASRDNMLCCHPEGQNEGFRIPEKYTWEMPVKTPAVLWLHFPLSQLSFQMLMIAATRGVRTLIFPAPGGWHRKSAAGALFERIWTRVRGNALRALSHVIDPTLRVGNLTAVSTSKGASRHDSKLEKVIGRVLAHPLIPLLPEDTFVRQKVLLANSSLAWGGAERQIVNTLFGLKESGAFCPSLLVENLRTRPDDDFYLWTLEGSSIPVRKLETTTGIDLLQDGDFSDRLARILRALPDPLAQDVWDYAVEISKTLPAVVHTWQDATNIKCGLAAAIVGVPRIILSGRNMAPWRFKYFQPYMRPAYRALLNLPNVSLLNNSRAGARDYESWLAVMSGTVGVVSNGMREEDFPTPTKEEIAAFRESLGIPSNHKVVGSVFRFYPEKDPMLWLDTAAQIASVRNDLSFVIAGTGIMHKAFLREAAVRGLSHRIHALGAERRVQLLLGAMDVFLLTSHLEGTPNAIIEAQWLGVPVVATDAGGTEDTFEDGVTGWLVKHRDPQILAQTVLNVLENPDAAGERATAAKRFAKTRFNLGRMIQETADWYEARRLNRPHQS